MNLRQRLLRLLHGSAARKKRRLERLLRGEGLSRSAAMRLVARYFGGDK